MNILKIKLKKKIKSTFKSQKIKIKQKKYYKIKKK